MKSDKQHNYILILPSLFTTGNLFCGFFSIVRSFNYHFDKAAFAILLAGLFDVLDGRVARMTNSTTKFGVEYDSLADVVSFGLAPSILLYVWVLKSYGDIGWAACFFFAACGALRLARFNSFASELPKSYFIGLPIPMAANTIASIAIVYKSYEFDNPSPVLLATMFALGLLMVSSIRYRSFKDFDLRHRRSFFLLVPLVGIIAIAAAHPEWTLLAIFAGYSLWSPLREAISLTKKLTTKKNSEETNGSKTN